MIKKNKLYVEKMVKIAIKVKEKEKFGIKWSRHKKSSKNSLQKAIGFTKHCILI